MKLSCSILIASLFSVGALMGCAVPSDGSNEESSFDSSAASSIRNPTLLGEVSLGETSSAVFTKGDTYHAWDIYLSERAAARFYTLPFDANGEAVDTRLYLYKEGTNNNWGTYLAKSDDAHNTAWSEISHNLTAGHYRLIAIGKNINSPSGYRVGFSAPALLGQDKCVFGRTFNQVRNGLTVKVVRERTIDSAAQLSDIEKAQVVDSMKASSYGEASTVEEALALVGGGELNLLHLYDQTNGKTYLAVEYDAGDNSYGRIYPTGSVESVTDIQDGDLYDCTIARGSVGVDCNATKACPGTLRCTGVNQVINKGACYDAEIGRANELGEWNATTICADDQYPAMYTQGDSGFCLPAWMQKSFESWQGYAIPDGRTTGVSSRIQAYGLATVDTDVELRATVRHAATSQLKVTLTNPAGTEKVVFDGATEGTDLFINQPVGYSGDESVNGTWTLKVIDKKRGTTGTLERWGLTIGSRWD